MHRFTIFIISIVLSFITVSVNAESTFDALNNATGKDVNRIMKDNNLEYYASDNVTNQIPYLDNRFRIDAQLEEITLIFYRKSGTPPIILVRPDGSKLKVSDHPEGKVEWFDDRTFDMIKIKKPMPGPWQAIGDILPESKILVVTDIIIDVEPIPEIVLSGETIKMTGRLVNGEQIINDPLFRAVVNLDVDFFSTNNSDYDNFGAEPVRLTTFRDDGEELDEYAKDVVFTGEFKLTFAEGEWLPIYLVKLPMFTRELKQKPVTLQKNPITIDVEMAEDETSQHTMLFKIDPQYVDPDTVLFQGKVTLPNRVKEPFSIMEGSGQTRTEKIPYSEAGVHRVNVNVFGKMKSGREFMLSVPEYTFNVERNEEALVASINYGGGAQESSSPEEQLQKTEEMLAEARIAQEALVKDKKINTIMYIVIGNIIIVGLTILSIFLYRLRKKKIREKEMTL